eukprot:9982554-Alexandrium_andersonii.AAC.1
MEVPNIGGGSAAAMAAARGAGPRAAAIGYLHSATSAHTSAVPGHDGSPSQRHGDAVGGWLPLCPQHLVGAELTCVSVDPPWVEALAQAHYGIRGPCPRLRFLGRQAVLAVPVQP